MAFFCLGWLILLSGLIIGPVSYGMFSILDIHTMMFAQLFAMFGQIIWGSGLYIAVSQSSTPLAYRYIINLREDILFWVSAGLMLICGAIFSYIFASWASNHFAHLGLQKETLFLISLAATGVLFISQCLTSHLLKRR
jgi:hypothetical protein